MYVRIKNAAVGHWAAESGRGGRNRNRAQAKSMRLKQKSLSSLLVSVVEYGAHGRLPKMRKKEKTMMSWVTR